MTDEQLRDSILRARKIAEPVGTLHSYWDVILDAEAILAGRLSIVGRAGVEKMFLEMFGCQENKE